MTPVHGRGLPCARPVNALAGFGGCRGLPGPGQGPPAEFRGRKAWLPPEKEQDGPFPGRQQRVARCLLKAAEDLHAAGRPKKPPPQVTLEDPRLPLRDLSQRAPPSSALPRISGTFWWKPSSCAWLERGRSNSASGSRHMVGPPSPAPKSLDRKTVASLLGGACWGKGGGREPYPPVHSLLLRPHLRSEGRKKKSFLTDPIWNLIVWTAAAALGCQPGWLPAWALDAAPPGPRPAANPNGPHKPGQGSPPTGGLPPSSKPTSSSQQPVPFLRWQLLAGPREAVILYIITNRGGPLTNRPA